MTVLFKILSVIAWILLAVILLLAWVIIVPRHFWVEYSMQDGPLIQMNIAFFRIRLYPVPDFFKKFVDKNTEKNQPDTDTGRQLTDDKKENLLKDIEFSFRLVKQVITAAKGIMKRIFKAIKFRDVSFTVPLHGRDIMATQQLYSAVTNSFYTLNIFLQQHLQLYYKSPVFVADFADRYSAATYFYCKITASPALLLSAAWFAYNQYLSIMAVNKKAQPATEKEIK